MELDGYNEELRLAFEYNGIQHYDAVAHFGGRKRLESLQGDDALKRKRCAARGVRLIVIPPLKTPRHRRRLKQLIKRECKAFGVRLPRQFDKTRIDLVPPRAVRGASSRNGGVA